MPIDLNNPFAQALISQGRARGYNPMSIAASIGNASAENGLRTNGAPGDSGTAFGGFQWRNERKAALDAKARAMGKTWDDPDVQAAHWYDEQDGSESRWGLKGARDLQTALNATVSSLRPQGWTPRDPTGSMHYDKRLSAAEEAFRQMNGGQAPPRIPGDLQPAPSDPETTGSIAPAPPKEGFEAFLDGGPGALFGKPQEGWNLGDALGGAGIAMMARDNPEGAARIAGYLNGNRKAERDKFENIYDKQSGKLIRIPRDGGPITTQQIGSAASTKSIVKVDPESGKAIIDNGDGTFGTQDMLPPKANPMSDGTQKLFQANNTAAEVAYNAAADTQKFTKMLMDGKVDLSAMGRMGNDFSNYLGNSDEKTRNAAQLYAHLEKLRNARLLEAKGVQTEGDASRALDALLPGSSKYDNKAVATLFRGLTDDFQKTYEQHQKYNEPLLRQFKDFDPSGSYTTKHQDRMGSLKAAREGIDGGWEAFVKPSEGGPEPTGRDPLKTPREKPKERFIDFVRRKEAEGAKANPRPGSRPEDVQLVGP